uniref:Uncharacterized protein n=1 Tax=Ditylenchus dipsaci TaxID=166011 RepID=A0A915CWR6_9BILA
MIIVIIISASNIGSRRKRTMHHMDESDIFSMLGGRWIFLWHGWRWHGWRLSEPCPRWWQTSSPQRRTTVQPLNLTLEELYKGKTSKLQLTKKVLCPTCNGVGGKPGAVRNCDKCRVAAKC